MKRKLKREGGEERRGEERRGSNLGADGASSGIDWPNTLCLCKANLEVLDRQPSGTLGAAEDRMRVRVEFRWFVEQEEEKEK